MTGAVALDAFTILLALAFGRMAFLFAGSDALAEYEFGYRLWITLSIVVPVGAFIAVVTVLTS